MLTLASYVWGGDALVFADTSLIWIDHVTTSYLGRQHYAFGQNPDSLITVSNSFLNGETSNSATCDNHTCMRPFDLPPKTLNSGT